MVIEWGYYKQEREPQGDGAEEAAAKGKGCSVGAQECEDGVFVQAGLPEEAVW